MPGTDKLTDGTSSSEGRRRLFVQRLPKIELHAHLNGSIRRSTLRELAAAKNVDPSNAIILARWPATLSEAFDVFRVIHSCVTTLQDVERLAYELGQDLEEDGVVYAEIRTTPRSMVPADGAKAEKQGSGLDEYVQAVLAGFSRYQQEPAKQSLSSGKNLPRPGKVILRLLLSIDRAKHSASQAQAIVDLAHRYSDRGVVGLDLSGDPTKGDWSAFEPALTRGRSLGLKVTLHAGEVRDRDEEMSRMLDLHPDRFGHCCFVSAPNLDRLRATRIPIELCLTSNLLSNSVSEVKDHHFGLHYRPIHSSVGMATKAGEGDGTICCISTDDSGVFGSTLSNEYNLVMQTFGLSESDTFHLARRTVEATFLTKPSSTVARSAGVKAEAVAKGDDQDWQSVHTRFDEFCNSWEWATA